ncbi:MAG: AAA family ATPase [bacterium]
MQDLTMHADYAAMLGYTQEEVERDFSDRITEFARITNVPADEILQKLHEWYNGYHFAKKDVFVYNPFSIVNVFSEFDLKNYWFETGTPTFLVNLIKENNYPIPISRISKSRNQPFRRMIWIT